MIEIETKRCGHCKIELPVEQFNISKSRKDGLCPWCRGCVSQDHQDNKELRNKAGRLYYGSHKKELAERGKKYREDNAENRSIWHKKYYEEHANEIAEQHRQYRIDNKEHINERNLLYKINNKDVIYERQKQWSIDNKETRDKDRAQYSIDNKERIRESRSLYNKSHPEQCRINNQNRRAAKLRLPSTLTIPEWGKIKEHFGDSCCYCGKIKFLAQDHFIAISKGGEYSKDNIVSSCKQCNSSKHDKDFFIWYPGYKYYSKKREKAILAYLGYENNIQQLALTF